MTTKVWLDGHQFDLQALADLFASGETRVIREGEEFYLTSPDIENPHDEKPYSVAGRLLPTLNGLGAIHHAGYRPVQLGGKVTDSGSTTIYPGACNLEVRAAITVSAVVTRADGTLVADDPSPWPGRFTLAAAHPDLAEALTIMGGANEPNWPDLYNVYEIVDRSIRPRKVHELLGVERTEVGRFTGSAQPHRHARPSGVPRNPMTLNEGRDFVNTLVTVWMESLA